MGKKLRTRAIERRDLPKLVAIASSRPVTRYLTTFRLPLGAYDEEKFLESVRSETDKAFVVETLRGRFVGLVGFHGMEPIDRCAEFGVLVADVRDFGRGFAAEAVRLGLVLGFERLNLHRLEVPVLEPNRVACAMYARLGFREEGRFRDRRFWEGGYVDVLVFAKLRTEYDAQEVWKNQGASAEKLRRKRVVGRSNVSKNALRR